MAVLLTVTGLVVYGIFRGDLNRSIDRSLVSRSAEVVAALRGSRAPPAVAGEGDDFTQVLAADGSLLAASPHVRGDALLAGAALRAAAVRPVMTEHPAIPALEGSLRIRAVPAASPRGRLIAVVGTALGERNDALRTLALLLGGGGAVALLLASLAGYGVASAALRPVEAMRRRAAAITPAGSGRRLPVPRSSDEIARLGKTLNEMLERIDAAFARERAFTADASHELRTPLSVLKAELELALRRGRSLEELHAALGSAAEETDRLARLAEDLLVLARVDEGRLELRTEPLDALELLETVAGRFAADSTGRRVRVAGGTLPIPLDGDRTRLEQALSNMVDNALRHGAGDVLLSAGASDGVVELHVVDRGDGFAPGFIDHAFERFSHAAEARSRGGAGLGLAIVAAVATSHRGTAHALNQPGGGADVWLELPRSNGTSGVSGAAGSPPGEAFVVP
jgi:two-component system, OmpR family, sensor kinase